MSTEKELKFHLEGISQFVDIYNAVNDIYGLDLEEGPFLRYVDSYFEDGDDHFRLRTMVSESDPNGLLMKVTRKSKPVMENGFMVRSEDEEAVTVNDLPRIYRNLKPVLAISCSRQIIYIKTDSVIAEMSLDTVEMASRMEQFVEIELKQEDAVGLEKLADLFGHLLTDKSKKQILMETQE